MVVTSSTHQTRKLTCARKPEISPLSSAKGKLKLRSTLASKSKARTPDSEQDERNASDQDIACKKEDEVCEDVGYETDEKEDAYDSDAIDEEDFAVGAKRKRSASGSSRSPKKSRTRTPRQKAHLKSKKVSAEHEDNHVLELQDGQEVVGSVVQAPKTGQVSPGLISQNTLNFLLQLKDPECNDRQWFKLHEPVYRQAENEWKAFVEAVTDQITEADPQVPPLPPKDLIHRVYRDVRFSNDKTPYKSNFSASFSRSGRKGIWAKLQPGGESIVAAGSWCPARTELMNIRINLQRRAGADRLREIISAPDFVGHFGEPCPSKDGSRQSIFGREDELKVAPKGIDKGHRDLDLLKCRSFAVVHRFLDSEVLAENFAEKVGQVVRIMRPFVHCLNDMMTVTGGDTDEEQGDDEDDD